jgi:hypothetical protein
MGRRIVFAFMVVALLAVAGIGYYLTHTPSDKVSDLMDLYQASVDVSSTPVAPVSAAQIASSSESASSYLKPPLPSNAQFTTWRNDMLAKCEAADKALKIQHFDVNADGLPDMVCWRMIKTRGHGDFVDLEARVTPVGRKLQTAYIILPAGTNDQVGVCESGHMIVKQELWTHKMFDDAGQDYAGPISITVGDGECDPAWLFWPKDAKGDQVGFVFERE